MKRLLAALFVVGGVLSACTGPLSPPPTPPPTALPTAVPPQGPSDAGAWALSFRYDFPPGTFGPGKHRYALLVHCPIVGIEDTNSGWYNFEISPDVVAQPTPLYLRLQGLSAEPFNPSLISNDQIHPERQIVAMVHLVGLSQHAAELAASGCEVLVFWDDWGRQGLTAGDLFKP